MKIRLPAPALLFLLLLAPLAHAAPCAVPGELVHWQADYCMNRSETDDFAAPSVQRCMNKEEKRSLPDVCAAKTDYKQKLCAQAVANGFQRSMAACMKDRKFTGPTVRDGGVS